MHTKEKEIFWQITNTDNNGQINLQGQKVFVKRYVNDINLHLSAYLARLVERLHWDIIGADVDDAPELEAVRRVRHPDLLTVIHAQLAPETGNDHKLKVE